MWFGKRNDVRIKHELQLPDSIWVRIEFQLIEMGFFFLKLQWTLIYRVQIWELRLSLELEPQMHCE